MARTLPIVRIVQSAGPGTPGRIVVSGNQVTSFQGKFYRQNVAPFAVQPIYSAASAPAGYSLIVATTFDVIDNPSYNGRYTVYTSTSSADLNSSSAFLAGNTEIAVNELVTAPSTIGDDIGIGSVTNISSYLISIEGEADLIVPPTVTLSDRPLDIIGRNGTPWAESYTQNFVKLAQNFASPISPVNPYLGQTWYNDSTNTFNLRTSSGWTAIASGVAGSNTTYREVVSTLNTTWIINHNLGLAAPYVGIIQVFVDIGGGVHKMIMPSDITFNSSNQLVISFSTAQTGVVLIRA